ncbi:T9SS type A sorting domain-containing protein, partial [bacterium]|nr:T9SS type A sorting domain-containing protein [bacterium]
FNSVLEIKLFVPENSYAEVFVSDVSGRIVEKIAGKTFTKGLYSFQWVPKDVCSGVYFVVVRSDNGTKIKRALLIK